MAMHQVWSPAAPAASDAGALARELRDIAERATSFTKASGAAVFLVHGDHLVAAATTGAVVAPGERLPLAGSFAGRAVQAARVARCDDADADSTVDVRPFLPLRVRSLIAVPIGGVGRPVSGVLVVVSDFPSCFNRTHLAILQTMADVVAEKCKTEGAFSAVLLAETEPRRSPLLDAHMTSTPAVESSVAPPAAPPTAIREVPVVLSAPLASNPVEKPARAMPISVVPARPIERVATAYDRPRASSSPSLDLRPILKAVVFAVVVISAVSWVMRHHSAANAAVTAAASQPAPASAAPSSVAEAAATAPVAEAKPAPQPERAAEERAAAKPASAEEDALVEPAAEEEAPAPPLHMPSSVAMHDNSYVPAPRVAISAKTAAPELLASPVAMPQAPVSKLIPARLTYRVAPEYPTLLRRFGKEGTVNLKVEIGPHGTVEKVDVVSGDDNFRPAAISAVKQWRYEPAVLDGKAVASSVEVGLRFSLPKK